ncbi:ComF family protein, partial [Acinetobacter baumannii]
LPNIIIPVPLHKTRLQERGFNQAIEIARVLTKKLNISMDKNSCQRIKATKPQTSLPAKQRANNIKNAFKCTSEAPYAHVALLDDVVTTGGTV